MNATTNIYIISDVSLSMRRHANRLQATLARITRAMCFVGRKTELHFIGYHDKARVLGVFERIYTGGNPNLGEGLSYLKSVMRYVQKCNGKKTRSIFILHSSGNVLYGWEKPLKELFKIREFAFGLRYVVSYNIPAKEAERAFNAFADSPDRVLPHFSENRLRALVRSISEQEAQVSCKIRSKR